MESLKGVTTFFAKRRLLLGIIFAVILALVMTAISLRLYDLDDVSRLDVSLPNRESIRSSANESEVQKFGSSGPLDEQALSDFQKLYTKNRTALEALGKFDSDALSSDSLRIGPNE
jgi:hypothetical protein